MPYFYYFLTWLFIIFSQIVIAPRIAFGDIQPDIVLAAAVLIGLKQGWKRGLWFGFAFGLTVDLANPQNYGWTTILVSFSGYYAGYVRDKIFLDHIAYQSLALLAFTLIYRLLFDLVNWTYYFINNFTQIFLSSALVALYTSLIGFIALFIIGHRTRLREIL